MNWQRAHWAVGTATLIVFPLAGAYMRYVAHVPDLSDARRLVYRSRFLFLLLIAVTNMWPPLHLPLLSFDRNYSIFIVFC
jgi:hypothetical protein